MQKIRDYLKSGLIKLRPYKKDFILILLIMPLAFILRIALMEDKVFINSDEVHYLFSALDTRTIFYSHSAYEVLVNIYRLFNFPWGSINPIYYSAYLSIYTLFGIPMTEFSLTIPSVILGTLCVLLVYIISFNLFNNETAILASLFVAISPIFIQTSRETAATGLMDAFLLMLLFITLSKYLSLKTTNPTNPNRWAFLVGLAIAMNILTDSQFLAVFLFILSLTAYHFFIINKKFSFGKLLFFTKKKYLNLYFLSIPTIVFSFLIALWLYPGISRGDFLNTSIGHLFFRGGALFNPGLHILDFIPYISLTSGWVITFLAPFSIVYGIYLLKERRKEAFLMIWFIIYTFPWLFVIKAPAIYRDFFHLWLIPLIILTSAILYLFFKKVYSCFNRATAFAVIFLSMSLICFVTLLTTFSAVFDMGPFHEPAYYGTVRENTGIKSAGYYFRSNFGKDTQVLSEFGSPIMKYYLNVNPLGNSTYLWTYFWPEMDKKYNEIKKDIPNADVLVLDYRHYEQFIKNMPNFEKSDFYAVAEVYSGDVPKIIILSREKKEYVRLDIGIYDKKFDDKYGNWGSLYIKDYYRY